MSLYREQLALAAKAAGYTILSSDVRAEAVYINESIPGKCGRYWNPRHDDGDALRLAVALAKAHKVICLSIGCEKTGCEFHFVQHADDPFAATREAIFIAAVEVGKAMR